MPAVNPLTSPLPANLPENWTYAQIISPNGVEVGFSQLYGYNYLMVQVNHAQDAINLLGQAFPGLAIPSDISSAVSAHNLNPESHPPLLTVTDNLDSRLTLLELKYATDVTGNSFQLDFITLDGMVVTGVWNKTFARIEF